MGVSIRRRIAVLGYAMVAVCAAVGWAQSPAPEEPRTLTIADLEETALANNPSLAEAAHAVQALRGKYVQVGLYPNPVIGYTSEEVGDGGRGGQHGMFLAQQVVTADKLHWNQAVVRREIAMAEQDYQMQRLCVLNDTRVAAYEVLAAQRTVDLAERLVDIGEKAEQAAERLRNARELSRVDVLQARIEVNTARLERDNARNDHLAAWRRLAATIGTPDQEPIPLEDRLDVPLPELNWEDSLSRLLAGSPELARAHEAVQRAQFALGRACAGRVPDFEVEAGVHYDFGSQDPLVSANLAVPLRLYDRNQGNIARARAELAAARQSVQRVELSLTNRLAECFRRYVNARQQVDRYNRDILPDANDTLDLVRGGYAQGEFGYLEMLTAQRTFFRVHLDYVTALRDLWSAGARIEGMLLTGALQAPGSQP